MSIKYRVIGFFLIATLLSFAFTNCSEIEMVKQQGKLDQDSGVEAPQSEVGVPIEASYFSIKVNIIESKCLECHSAQNPQGDVDLSDYTKLMDYVDTEDPQESELYLSTLDGTMPPEPQHPLSNEELTAILQWIINGAPEE